MSTNMLEEQDDLKTNLEDANVELEEARKEIQELDEVKTSAKVQTFPSYSILTPAAVLTKTTYVVV